MKKKITAIVLLVSGIGALLFGIFYSGASSSGKKADIEMDITNVVYLTDENIGKSIKIKLTDDQLYINDNNFFLLGEADASITSISFTSI